MTRPLRIEYPGAFYHVISRGTGLLWLYKTPRNFSAFVGLLDAVRIKYGFRIYAFILMRNHYHILIETPLPNLSRGMLYLNRELARTFNKAIRREGAVFRARYKAILIEQEKYFLNVFSYVNKNAVRGGISESVASYPGGIWRYLSGKCDGALKNKIKDLIYWKGVKERVGISTPAKIVEWLDTEHRLPYFELQTYKYLLGSSKWTECMREKHTSKSGALPETALGKKMKIIDTRNEKIWRIMQKFKKEDRFKDIAVYFMSKYCDLTQQQMAEKLGLSSANAVGQRLFRLRFSMKKDNAFFKRLERIDRAEFRKM